MTKLIGVDRSNTSGHTQIVGLACYVIGSFKMCRC